MVKVYFCFRFLRDLGTNATVEPEIVELPVFPLLVFVGLALLTNPALLLQPLSRSVGPS